MDVMGPLADATNDGNILVFGKTRCFRAGM